MVSNHICSSFGFRPPPQKVVNGAKRVAVTTVLVLHVGNGRSEQDTMILTIRASCSLAVECGCLGNLARRRSGKQGGLGGLWPANDEAI